MKKALNKLILLILVIATMLSTVGCKPEVVEEIDKNKTQIYVSIYNGGYGTEWFNMLKKDFEADYPEYQIMVTPAKDSGQTINELIKSSQGTYNVYISGDYRHTKDLIDLDCLVDLSDVYTSKAASDEAKTIEQKMKNAETYKTAYSKEGGSGVYVIPYSSGFTGLVFDYDLFVENNWLANPREDICSRSTAFIKPTKRAPLSDERVCIPTNLTTGA